MSRRLLQVWFGNGFIGKTKGLFIVNVFYMTASCHSVDEFFVLHIY